MNLKRIFNRLIDNESLRTDTTPAMTAQEPQKSEITNTMSHDQPMTPEEAIQECIKIDPERSYKVEVSKWYHHKDAYRKNTKIDPTEYELFVYPGIVSCSYGDRYKGKSLAAAILVYRAAHAAWSAIPKVD